MIGQASPAGGSGGRFSTQASPAALPAAAPAAPVFAAPAAAPARESAAELLDLKTRLHHALLEDINFAVVDKLPPDEFRRQIGEMARDLLAREQLLLNLREQTQIVGEIVDEVVGLGPLEPLLADSTVSEILVNTHAKVVVERFGKLEPTRIRFKDDRHLLRIINKIVGHVGRRVDESQPLVDARLPDGSRVNAVIPPVAVDGPQLSIRKFARTPLDLERLAGLGTLCRPMALLLEAAIKGKLNLLVSGGTGSGKTTLLNALSAGIDPAERIVTIEDAAELQLLQPQVVRLETRPANVEGKGEISQRDLLRNALRMRPDRIILGEVRAGEAFDMLQAMNTGHGGSLSTIHANTCRDALSRLEQMIGMAGLEMAPRTVRAQIVSAIRLVVQIERMSDGRRRLVSIQELAGLEGEVVTLSEIFLFRRQGVGRDGTVLGQFWATGLRPHFVDDLAARGIELPRDLFAGDRPLA